MLTHTRNILLLAIVLVFWGCSGSVQDKPDGGGEDAGDRDGAVDAAGDDGGESGDPGKDGA